MAELNAKSGSSTMPIDTDDMTTNRSDDVKSTPLKKYITSVENKRGKWTCNFGCRVVPYTGTYSCIRAHLIGLYPRQKAQVHGAPRGYKPPSAEKIRTALLDKEISKVDQALMPLRE